MRFSAPDSPKKRSPCEFGSSHTIGLNYEPQLPNPEHLNLKAWCALRSYKKLAIDVKVGSQILCADGSIVLEVLETNPEQGTVRCKCCNNASLGCAPRSHDLKVPCTIPCPNEDLLTSAVKGLLRIGSPASTDDQAWLCTHTDHMVGRRGNAGL